jgi:hypothetical protein
MESGGDMSITNSNSNFGNTSLHAIGFKGFAFNQDKGGYLTDIIPPRVVGTEAEDIKKVQYYTVDIQGTRAGEDNFTKLFLGSSDILEPIDRPAVTLDGFRLGAKTDEKLYVNLDPVGDTGTNEFTATLEPTGFLKYVAVPSILNPIGVNFAIDNRAADAANLIEKNRTMIQEEVFGYILELHPRLQNISYVNPGRDVNANRYFDAYDLITANREYIVNQTLISTSLTFPASNINFDAVAEIVDAVAEDIRDGGNNNIIAQVKDYFDFNGSQTRYPTTTSREEANWAFNRARDLCKKAVANLLPNKADLYDPDPNSTLFNGNTNKYPQFIAGKGQTGSQAEAAGDTTNGVTYDASNLIDPAGRYKDARNRIVANKEYILDSALAEIAVYDDAPFFYFPGDGQETPRSRYKTAYRLIRRNRQYAIDTAIAAIQAQYPSFNFPGGTTTKCERDLGFFVDAVGLDIFLDGNFWARAFASKYFNTDGVLIADGVDQEISQSIFGFNAARDALMDAVSNQLSGQYTDSSVLPGESVYGDGNGDVTNTDPAACQDVQNGISTLTTIITQVLNDGNLNSIEDVNNPNYVTPTERGLAAGESKCRRDIGHIVDGIAQDLWFGGNEYTIANTRAYFDKSNNLITNGVDNEKEQAITAFKRISDASNQAINNLLYNQDRNITLDQTGDPAIVGDLFADAYNQVIKNKEWLAKEGYERMLLDYENNGVTWTPRSGTSEQDCLDDVYAVLEEVMWNVKFGGNHKAWDSAEVYVTNIFAGTNPKRYTPTTATYDAASGISILTIPNHGMVAGQYIRIATGGLTFTCALDNYQTATAYPRASDPAADTWLNIVSADTNTITVNVGASDPSDVYQHQFVSAVNDSVTYGTLQTTFLDYERDAARKVFEFVKTVGIDVIRNQSVIPSSSNDLVQFIDLTIVEDWDNPTCQGAVDAFSTLMDMITDAIGSVASGAGNLPVAARSVPQQPQSITGASGEVGYQIGNCSDVLQTIDTLVGIISDAIAGQGNSGFASLSNLPPLTHGDWDCANVRSTIETLFDIASDAVIDSNLSGLPPINNGGFNNDPTSSKCYRDVSYIVDAVVNDLRFGGNINSIQAGEAYYVGTSTETRYTPTSATYDPATGDFTMVVPNHTVEQGRNIRLVDNSFTFTCGMDGNQSEKTYPRPGIDPYANRSIEVTSVTSNSITCNVGASGPNVEFTPSGATYDPSTGDLVLTIGAHDLSVGEGVVIDNNSLSFTCGMDNNDSVKSYPRSGIDPFSGRSMPITSRSSTTITINAGVSGPNVAFTPTGAIYNPVTGDMTVTVAQHGLGVGRSVVFVDNSFTFECDLDNRATQHTYPRPGQDPWAGKSITISSVGYSVHTATDAPYDAATGVVTLTVSNHGFSNGDYVQIANNSLTYTCDLDGNVSEKTYPRANYDYPSGRWLAISNVTSNTFDINVGSSDYTGTHTFVSAVAGGIQRQDGTFTLNVGTSSDTSTHYFISATTGAIKHEPQSVHQFTGASANCVKHLPQVTHTFVRASTDALITGGAQLDYIDGEKIETVDAWKYVRDMAIAAMRNFDVLIKDCDTTFGSAIVNVGDTKGLLIGMKVAEYDETGGNAPYGTNGLLVPSAIQIFDNISDETYIKRIVDNQNIELGFKGSKFNIGELRNANQTESTNLYFTFEEGVWADTLPTLSDVGNAANNPEVIQDDLYPECAGVKATIDSLVGDIIDVIQSGPGTVTRVESTADPGQFTKRSTIFTINTDPGVNNTDPHEFETGTPVRLVPRPRFDLTKREYVDVDKRLVRLPNGFETNTTYYVIAPGRRTQPTDYANATGIFDSAAQNKLMLATSPENAAAGIYIYSSESDSIDRDVEIDIYQFVLDIKYDLHSYTCSLSGSVTNGIETDVSHIFDVPFASVEPQRVFFRANPGNDLPSIAGASGAGSTNQAEDPFIATTDNLNANFGRLNYNSEFYVRYENDKTVTIYISHSDAINENDPVRFVPGNYSFKMYANKRRSPVRFDAGFTNTFADTGKWFVNCKNEADITSIPSTTYEQNIIWRVNQQDLADRRRSTDMWFTRIEDKREADDRTYKLRYVIPKYLANARDPINGFVIKTRTDDTRKLVPQRVLLKPVAGNVYTADFRNPVQAAEKIGFNQFEFDAANLDIDTSYDPYRKDLTNDGIQYAKFAKFNSGIQATIQSAVKVQDPLDFNINYLELTVFDLTINAVDFSGLKNETFTTVQINAPQGGDWIVNKTEQTEESRVYWGGYSSGLANIHQYFSIGGEHYLILKNIRGGKLEFSDYANVQFTQDQGNGTVVFADMLTDQDFGKSLPLKTLIRKKYPQYYYKQNGANVYTITPGDTIQDDAGNEYYVDSVEDAGVIEDTFYVFNYETLQRRISGQQDGIYYLSCLRGNISPFPQGAGVTENFKKYKFSQPVSSLYPLNYKNDPLWFQKAGTSPEELAIVENLLDPPATYSAANNYVHGLVTTNDFKGSVTRELVEDLIANPAFKDYDFVNEAQIEAQIGNATSGSEDRKISISGTSTVVSDQRYYVELRRPSIARAGNHTFEYLGFGPGNYSTGLPARQEIVLSPTEDFYAQSKKQDAGIVFYTGLNSNGDLYIGNRKINAITGEETFLERAALTDSEDEDDDLGNLVTTFNTPVTFNQNITVVGGDGDLPNTFSSPIVISVQDNDLTEVRDCLIIRSNVSSIDPVTNEQQDESLDNDNFRPRTKGDIRISKNRVQAALFGITARRDGQDYQIQTHEYAGIPSNISPNNSPLVGDGGTRVYVNQFVNYNGVLARSGDILLKGLEVGKTGSIGWVNANFYQDVNNGNISTIEFDGTTVVKIVWFDSFSQQNIKNKDLEGIGIDAASQIKLSNYWPNIDLNGIWTVYNNPADPFDPEDNYVYFQVATNQDVSLKNWASAVISSPPRPGGTQTPLVEISKAIWKEFGVLGAEALRTNTDTWGEFKLGVNTVARSAHIDSQTAFVSDETSPRANLDVVGTAFISGKTIENYLTETSTLKVETEQDNALLVGGDSTDPDDTSVLRVMTTNGGRLGINTKVQDTINPYKELNKTFVVVGDARIHENLEITGDLEVNGGDITTTNTDFALAPANAVRVNLFGVADRINIATNTTLPQEINLGTSTSNQHVRIGTTAVDSTLRIHTNSQNAIVDLATVQNQSSSICQLRFGGGYVTRSTTNSVTNIDTFFTNIKSKEVEFGSGEGEGSSESRIYSSTRSVRAFDGDLTNTLKLGTNATTFEMGSTGGTTTIRNTLNVLASAIVEGNIRLDGGLNAGIIEIERGRFNTTIVPHVIGGVENSNIDFYQYVDTGRRIDTGGVAPWGGTSYLVAGGAISTFDTVVNTNGDSRRPGTYPFVNTTTDGVGSGATITLLVRFDKTIELTLESPGEGYAIGDQIIIQPGDIGGTETDATLPAGQLTFIVQGVVDTGTLYYLPIDEPAITDFSRGDLLFIDRGSDLSPDTVGSGPNQITGLRNQAESEILRIEGIANVTNPSDTNGYRLIVSRGADGSGIYNNHPDETYIAKFIKQSNASYITGSDLDSDGQLDEPLSGIGSGSGDIRIGVAEFGGSLSTRDFLRLSKSEFVSVKTLISTSPQSLIVNTGDPSGANDTFRVESTTGNTFIFGHIYAGAGFNRFIVDSSTGDTTTTGKLTTNDTITLRGTTVFAQPEQLFKVTEQGSTEFLTLTNGGNSEITEAVTFQVDTATGSIYSTGSMKFFGVDNNGVADLTDPKLDFDGSNGNLTVYGSLSALGSGISYFGGSLDIEGGINLKYQDGAGRTQLDQELSIKNIAGDEIFKVLNNGSVTVAGQSNYFSNTGGRKWEYSADAVIPAEVNVNYFINAGGNTIVKLPGDAQMGDMIRIIDIGGALTYNVSLVIRALTNQRVMNDGSNTGSSLLTGVPASQYATHGGGELVVQTPYAAFALVYAGNIVEGESGQSVPSSRTGWYLINV